jgi:phospholipase/lecithinase/hemolysin/cyclophilin family peptidyl-prolyl cis-trans isomerase/Ca2+-binding RTX toxin-like protein
MATNNIPDPVVTNPINDQIVNIDAPDTKIDLSNYFDDPLTTGKVAHFNLANTSTGTIGNGIINVVLFDQAEIGSPLTVQNFQSYVDADSYTNSFIHRSIPGFIVQGGGYTYDNSTLLDVLANAPVQNEFSTERSNLRGTIAMAKLGDDPNSATNQWFFNLADNSANLDNQNGGFTVFGQAISDNDLATIDAIAAVPIYNAGGAFTNLPLTQNTNSDDNFIRFSSITVTAEDELEFSIVDNSKPTLVTPSIINQQLVLDYLPNQTGNSDITIRATNLFGEFVDYTFTAIVLPTISLDLSATSVSEDGADNLVYTFTRNGDLSNALTANYNISSTATFNTDYAQIGADSFTPNTGSITFAANSATATLTIDSIPDTTIEDDETIAITLVTGTDYAIDTTTVVTGIITNDDFPFINQIPTLANPIADQIAKVNSTFTFTLPKDTFFDPDAVNPYTNLVIFGDSLSDTGNAYKLSGNTFPAPPNYQGRISNGLIWVDYFAPDLQFTNQSIQNYAFIGANTGISNTFNQITVPGLLTQIQEFQTVNANSIGEDGLYVIWAGANDFLNIPSDITQAVTDAVNNIGSAITTLAGLGAKEIVIGNLTDLGSLPGIIADNNVDNARAISIGFNTALTQALNNLEIALNIDLVLVDIFGLSTAVQTNPTNYKFTNITQPLITASNLVDPDQYAFWDTIHPSTRLHQLVTDTFENILLNENIIPDLVRYSATLADGSNLPDWLNFNSTTRTFSGTPKIEVTGSLDVKVIATDKAGATVSDIFTLTVENVNNAPTLINPIADQTTNEDQTFTFQIPSNTFTDIEAGDILTYSATLENGDALPSWLIFDGENQTFSGTPTNDNVGSLNVQVTATDKAGATVSDIFVVAVENVNDTPTLANPITDQTTNEDQTFNFQIPSNTFTDIDTDDVITYSATLENGDALPSWLTFDATTQTFSGTPTNDNVGSLNVKVTATDKAEATVSDIFVVAVENIVNDKLISVGTPGDDKLTATAGSQFNGQRNLVFTGAGNDTVDLGTVTTFPTAIDNIINLGSGDDTIYVNKGDRVFGGTGNDSFYAVDGQGSNRMSGGAGDDEFWLGSNDRAIGGNGQDIFIIGVGGGNLISGGAGADQFWIVTAELVKTPNTVVDFQLGTDVIRINGGGITTSTLKLNQIGADTAISFNDQTLAILTGIQANSLNLNDTNQFILA